MSIVTEFEIGSTYSREQIHEIVGGSLQSYMPHVNGRVRAICIRKELNPSFREFLESTYLLPSGIKAILVGKGKGIELSASLIAEQKRDPIPTFIKREANKWEYLGAYEYYSQTGTNKTLIKAYSKYADRADQIVNVIFVRSLQSTIVLKRAR